MPDHRPLDFINLPLILLSVLFFALGWFVASRSPNRKLGIRFLVFCGVYGIYSLSIGILALFRDRHIATWAGQAASAFGVFCMPIMYDFLMTASVVDPRKLRWLRGMAYGIATLFTGIFAWQIVVTGLEEHWWGYYPKRSELLPAFAAFISVLVFHAEWVLWKRSRETPSVLVRNQLRMLFWSTLLTIPSASSNIAFCLYGIGRYPFSSLGGMLYAGILAYAVIRYRLLDIDIALRKGALYAALTALLTAFFLGAVLGIQGLLVQKNWDVILPSVISTMVVAMLLQPFRGRIQSAIDRRFFRSSYEHQQAVARFTETIVSKLDLQQAIDRMVQLVCETFYVPRVGVFLVNGSEDRFDFISGVGFDEHRPVPTLSREAAVIKWFCEHREPLLRADVEWHPLMSDAAMQTAIVSELDAVGAKVLIAIHYEGKLRGFIALGDKASGERYTHEDLQLLETVAHEAAVAIENARLVDALREEHRRKARFITDMAHELKTPVTSIKMFAEILADGVEDPEKRRQFLDILVNESSRYVGLVDDFLYFTRMDTGDVPLRERRFSLGELVEETVAMFQVQAAERKLRLRFEPPAVEGRAEEIVGKDTHVLADRDKIKQVLVNLIDNAIKYTGSGGEVTVELVSSDGFVETRVRDTGIGIPANELTDIFEKYYRTRHARSMTGAGGAGIGLTIARDIVAKHGGALTVQSEAGKGSVFVMRLPLV